MKKIFTLVLFALLIIFSGIASPQMAFASSISDNSVIILSGSVQSGNMLVIDANMRVNTGIGAMVLEISYDKSAMLLSGITFGSALSALDPVTTNVDTPQGYAITPFKINYLSQEKGNDFTTGKLFTLTFRLLDDIKDGSYRVSLKYEKNKDVNYFEQGGVKTKNLYIDNAEIQIKNNSVTDIKAVRDEESTSDFLIIALSISIPIIVSAVVLVAIKSTRKKRDWERI